MVVYVALAAAGFGGTIAAAGVALVGRHEDVALVEAVTRSLSTFSEVEHPRGLKARITQFAEHQPYVTKLAPSMALAEVTLANLVSQALLLAGICGLLGLSLPAIFAIAGVREAAFLAPLGAVLGAVFGVLISISALERRAEARRRHLHRQMASYISLMALAVAGQMGLESAVQAAARVSDDWVFRLIRSELSTIRRANRPVYVVFEVLGERFGEADFSAMANTLRQSVESGSGLRQSLEAKADSLREQRMIGMEAEAGRTTQKMFIPSSVMFVGYLVLLVYPQLSHIASAM